MVQIQPRGIGFPFVLGIDKWSHLRNTVLTKYSSFIHDLPPCFRECGLFPQELIDDGSYSFDFAKNLTRDVQLMMIAIIQGRGSLERKAMVLRPSSQVNNPPAEPSASKTCQSPLTTEELFPNYPWTYEVETRFGKPFFSGTVPKNWRTHKKGSEWTFGLQTFGALHWYWSQLCWPNHSEEGPGITWFELALDFAASTHCPLHMPEDSSSGSARVSSTMPAGVWPLYVTAH